MGPSAPAEASRARRLPMALALLFALPACATVAPPVITPGAVDPSLLDRGDGAVSFEGAVGVLPGPAQPPMAALGAMHGDLGLGKRWVARFDVEALGVMRQGLGGGRLGLRRSSADGRSSIGMGVGGGITGMSGGRPMGWVAPDWEVAVQERWGLMSAGFVTRAGVTAPFEPALHNVTLTLSWSTQFTLGVEPSPGHRLLVVVPAGVAVSPSSGDTAGWVGGGVGYQVRFGEAAADRQRRRALPPPS